MISFLQGKIEFKTDKFLVIDVNGVGYRVFCSGKTLSKVPQNQEVFKLFTYLYVRENSLDLYGFLTREELGLFEMLNEISGIGPKAALVIASTGSFEEIKKAIESGDQGFFEGVRGIGRKKIQKIILELTGKIGEISAEKKTPLPKDEALGALINLGFPQQKARQALESVSDETKETSQRVKEALKILGSR